jgi:2-succinyl-6-hydroxy-2,4-cyclohexadiene-1-carboxylate synthase
VRIALLHGFAGDAHAWDDTRAAWPTSDDELSAIALPGHGGGDVAETWRDNVVQVERAVAGADLVVGYSLGARVALGLVVERRIERAILIGVNPGLSDGERSARRAADAEWAALLRTRGVAAFSDAWQAQPLFASQSSVDPRRLAARRARRCALDAEALARSLEVMGLAEMPDMRSELGAANVTLIVGALDTKFAALAHALAAPTVTIAGSGHDPTLEQPHALARELTRIARAGRRGS